MKTSIVAMSPIAAAALLLVACVGVPEDVDIDLVEQAWTEFGDGAGVVRLDTPNRTIEVPVELSSEFWPDVDPVEGNIVVLRGEANGATVAVVLAPERVYMGVSDLQNGTFYRMNAPQLPVYRVDSLPHSAPPIYHESMTAAEMAAREGTAVNPEIADMQVQHIAPFGGGSILTTKYVYKDHRPDDAREPVNVFTYGNASQTRSIIDGLSGFSERCGSDSDMWFFDRRHGGVDDWQEPNIHLANGSCPGSRYHVKIYNSKTGDTHGLGEYAGLASHWENWTHFDVRPQAGQDFLLSELSDHPSIASNQMWLTSVENCKHCDSWDGWVDAYHVSGRGACTPVRSDYTCGSYECHFLQCQ